MTPYPLEVKRAPPSFTRDDSEALSIEFERLLRKAGADVPDSAAYGQALSELKRQDCDRDDECLRQLAQLARTLYGLYAEIDNTLAGQVVATGRLVRSDGAPMGRPRVVKLPRGKGRFGDVAQAALAKLLEELKVSELPAQRTVQPDAPRAEPAPVAQPGPAPLPAPAPAAAPQPALAAAPPPPPRPGLRRLAWIPGAFAGAAAVTAGVTYGFAADLHGQLTQGQFSSGADAAAAAQRGETLQAVSAVSAGVGIAAAAVFIWFLAVGPGPAPAAVPEPAAAPAGAASW